MRHILNLATKTGPFNCLTSPTHERYQSNMDEIDCNFYMFRDEGIKGWTDSYAQLPENHIILPERYIPRGIDFDFVLSQNRFGQYQKLSAIAQQLQIPLITIEHTLPAPFWTPQFTKAAGQMRGMVDCYISDFSAKKWGAERYLVIPHCIDTKVFNSGDNPDRRNHVLSVANDFVNRDYCLNFTQYAKVTQGLPVMPVGDTPGFSKPASSVEELVNFYRTSRIFINTAHWSPIPMSLLEAMACGCACVSVDACAISEYIVHGENGFLANNDEEMRHYLELLLNDEATAMMLGVNAAETIKQKCSKDRFTTNWNNLFRGVYESQAIARK